MRMYTKFGARKSSIEIGVALQSDRQRGMHVYIRTSAWNARRCEVGPAVLVCNYLGLERLRTQRQGRPESATCVVRHLWQGLTGEKHGRALLSFYFFNEVMFILEFEVLFFANPGKGHISFWEIHAAKEGEGGGITIQEPGPP